MGRGERKAKQKKCLYGHKFYSLEDVWEILLLERTIQINQTVGVINVKLELFVLNVRIYENVLLILNLCKVSKLCIVT